MEKSNLEKHVEERFGVLPNLFRLNPETPEITAALWGFAQFAYLDNPLPTVFKERLFVYLSRFCEARYCIARHVGFLAGLGRPSGDAQAPPESIEKIVRLLHQPFPQGEALVPLYSVITGWLEDMPASGSEAEGALLAFAGQVFLNTADASASLVVLRGALGTVRLQYLILLMSFLRTVHYWTRVHPELLLDDDVKELLATNNALAEYILRDKQYCTSEVTQRILNELPALKDQATVAANLLAAIVDSSEDAIISKTLEGIITSWNKSAVLLYGYSPEQAIGQSITIIIPRNRLDEEKKIIEKLCRGERIDHFETVRKRKDGTEVEVALTISPVRDGKGRVVGASKVARDITERKVEERVRRENERRLKNLAESLDAEVRLRTAELEQRNTEVLRQSDELRQLSSRLLQSQDDERRRLARDLHDSAGQLLVGLGLNIANISRNAEQSSSVLKIVKDSEELLQQLNQEIRTMSYLLHPPLLDESGLPQAIQWYVSGLAERSGLKIELVAAEDFGRIAPDLELALFRIVQECLTNIHRHSGSKVGSVRLSRGSDAVLLEVSDEGKGMPREESALNQARPGVGIAGIRERVRHLGGTLDIQSSDKGTNISVSLPISSTASGFLESAAS